MRYAYLAGLIAGVGLGLVVAQIISDQRIIAIAGVAMAIGGSLWADHLLNGGKRHAG